VPHTCFGGNAASAALEDYAMTARPKVQGEGQVTLPVEVREAAGIEPGDVVDFRVVGPGKVELTVRRSMSLDEWRARYGGGEPIGDWSKFIEEAEADLGDELVQRIRNGVE
jgi:AbrB family looped-hinge helix DNA binding protein